MASKTTLFTKKYIQDRIAARRKSLESAIEQAERVIADWWESIDEKLYEIHDNQRITTERLVSSQRESVVAFAEAKNPIERQQALMLWGTTGDLQTYVPQLPSPRNSHYSSDVEKAGLVIENASRELALLDHATAYFDEIPVEEFSLTSIQKLGLLDAIKFSITPPKTV